jgi:phosphoribosyl 1,2-cyclic phosphodiesterase
MKDKVRFYGVRGSIATPGLQTRATGGNTSCVRVDLGGECIVLDGGTGLRALGAEIGNRPLKATILFSHLHWDHIQGIPFFGPLYNPESRITLVGPEGLEDALQAQMSRPNFPVGMEVMGAKIKFLTVYPGDAFAVGSVKVETAALNHPGGAIGYRLSRNGRTVAYLCDHEHTDYGFGDELRDLARDADLLIYDAQYLPEEYPQKTGWGHSTYEIGAELARAAGARRLVLTHHEPSRSDAEVDSMECRVRVMFNNAWAAREGGEFELGGKAESVPADRMLERYLATTLATG